MVWNHRIVKVEDGFQFAEVFYRDSDKKPFAYSEICTFGDDVAELKELAARLLSAADQPVLDPAEFVQED